MSEGFPDIVRRNATGVLSGSIRFSHFVSAFNFQTVKQAITKHYDMYSQEQTGKVLGKKLRKFFESEGYFRE